MKRKRRDRARRRRVQVTRGRNLVVLSLTASVLYSGMFLFFAASGEGILGGMLSSTPLLASLMAGGFFVLGAWLAVGAYLGHLVLRRIYLTLVCVSGLLGILWIGFQSAQRTPTEWLLFDVAGLGVALLVCWVFFSSRSGKSFFDDQEFMVKRK